MLYRFLGALNRALDIHRQSTPRDELYKRLRNANTYPNGVILDEVDQLEGQDVLYDLYALPHLTMILIANDEQELFTGLDDRLYSRLRRSECIEFDQYSMNELVGILEQRVQRGLNDETSIERISSRLLTLSLGMHESRSEFYGRRSVKHLGMVRPSSQAKISTARSPKHARNSIEKRSINLSKTNNFSTGSSPTG